jgi:DNA-binding XRE family transcriptional regulator
LINTPKLKGRMAEHDYTQETLAKALNMSRAGFNQKLNNKPRNQFTVEQVYEMRKLLKINDPAEADGIFFAHEVSNRKQKEAQN